MENRVTTRAMAKNAAKTQDESNTVKARRGKKAEARRNTVKSQLGKTVRTGNKDAADADDEPDVDKTVKTRLDDTIEIQGDERTETGTIKYTIILVAVLSWILCGAFFAHKTNPVVAVPKDEVKGRLCALQFEIHSEYNRHHSFYDLIGITISDTTDDIIVSLPMQIRKTVERDPEDDGEFNGRMAVVNVASLVLATHKERERYNLEIYGPSGLAELDGVEKRLEDAQRAQNQKACKREGEKAAAMQADVDARLREVCKGYIPGELHV
ncbi:hypothetical protein EDB80DRAFT_676831 [Ilyonectria destructans]|nr:hypothetical protein EDB80DRAFT_676831 [Ilyonectria destructans]